MEHAEVDEVVRINLLGHGGTYVMVIDRADYPLMARYKWRVFIHPQRRPRYAYVMVPTPKGQQRILAHRLILGNQLQPGLQTDHANGNGLDNRRSNLRVATPSQNAANSFNKRRKRFKGLYRRTKKGWIIQVRCLGIGHHAGPFPSEEEAAMAYNVVARRIFGEFARLNVVEMG